jgi:6,7-dimethyl-8-ribityllumazine synthase
VWTNKQKHTTALLTDICQCDKKIAITVGYFYQEIGDKLLIGAQQTLSKYGIDEKNVDIFYAPGAFEI